MDDNVSLMRQRGREGVLTMRYKLYPFHTFAACVQFLPVLLFQPVSTVVILAFRFCHAHLTILPACDLTRLAQDALKSARHVYKSAEKEKKKHEKHEKMEKRKMEKNEET